MTTEGTPPLTAPAPSPAPPPGPGLDGRARLGPRTLRRLARMDVLVRFQSLFGLVAVFIAGVVLSPTTAGEWAWCPLWT